MAEQQLYQQPCARDVSDPPALHPQCLTMVQHLSQLLGAVFMGRTAGSSIP